ncbi:hypothetical protein HYS47_00835 [Candidatus Woesearchaeota archaeon]|nr:hypothetical protein [Candidatus Woesearchaeota archaeon]
MSNDEKYPFFEPSSELGVSAGDFVSVIDRLCPLQSGGFASCATNTARKGDVVEIYTARAIRSYVLHAYDSGIGLDKVLDTIDEARRVVIERYKLQGTSQPSLYVLPGMIIDQAEEILKLNDPPTFPSRQDDKSF